MSEEPLCVKGEILFNAFSASCTSNTWRSSTCADPITPHHWYWKKINVVIVASPACWPAVAGGLTAVSHHPRPQIAIILPRPLPKPLLMLACHPCPPSKHFFFWIHLSQNILLLQH
jgi:hypothetical protein